MPLDDLGTPDDWQAVQKNWVARTTAEGVRLRSDGGDPIVALRAHFAENIERLSQQILQAEGELRSLRLQHYAFTAGLRAIDGPKIEAIITPEH
jgi:hypothetical protein